MINHAQPTLPSAAASFHGAASPSLELLEARQLRDALARLLRREQASMADFLVALAGFDHRRGWEPLGHASLFAFLHVELRLSRNAAFWRLSAARLLQRLPQVIEPLRDGRLCLSTTAELAKVLTEENIGAVMPRYYRLSAREAAEVTAELQPRERPPLRTVVTSLEPERRPTAMVAAPPVEAAQAAVGTSGFHLTRTEGAVLTSEPTLGPCMTFQAPRRQVADSARPAVTRDDVEPLTAGLSRIHATVSRQFLKKLASARDGLSHAIPGATMEQVLEAALDLLLEKQAKARGQVKRPRAAPAHPTAPPTPIEPPTRRRTGPRETIPVAVRRAVWERDAGRCTWPLDGGGWCGSTHRLELDHIIPWAEWGPSTAENLRIVCERHNALAARRAFGERQMRRYGGGVGQRTG